MDEISDKNFKKQELQRNTNSVKLRRMVTNTITVG